MSEFSKNILTFSTVQALFAQKSCFFPLKEIVKEKLKDF